MKTGIDVFNENSNAILKNRNIVLITGSSNVDASGTPVYKIVKEKAGNRLKAIWSLQHGFFIDKQDNMILSDSFYWEPFDIEIKSLYGNNLLPDASWLDGVDALLIDIFDIGTRVYTFVNHVLMIMRYLVTLAEKNLNVDIIVLDRPNPINGIDCEGNVMSSTHFSIVGQLPVPMRHSLTAGEFLSYGLNYYQLDLQLEIITAKQWKRDKLLNAHWTYPSPNMPGLNTAVVYPGSVMLEGTNLSEGRGTTRPFEIIGAPFIDNHALAEELNDLKILDANFTPIYFKPEFSKFAGEICKGLLVLPQNPNEFKSFRAFYEIIRMIYHRYPEQFSWKLPPYEFEYQRLPIDMICGSDFIRTSIEKNLKFSEIEPTIDIEIQNFKEDVVEHLLYS